MAFFGKSPPKEWFFSEKMKNQCVVEPNKSNEVGNFFKKKKKTLAKGTLVRNRMVWSPAKGHILCPRFVFFYINNFLIEKNTLALVICLQKTPSRRLQDVLIKILMKTSCLISSNCFLFLYFSTYGIDITIQ